MNFPLPKAGIWLAARVDWALLLSSQSLGQLVNHKVKSRPGSRGAYTPSGPSLGRPVFTNVSPLPGQKNLPEASCFSKLERRGWRERLGARARVRRACASGSAAARPGSLASARAPAQRDEETGSPLGPGACALWAPGLPA